MQQNMLFQNASFKSIMHYLSYFACYADNKVPAFKLISTVIQLKKDLNTELDRFGRFGKRKYLI